MARNPAWDAEQLRRAATAVRNLIKGTDGKGEWADWVPRDLERIADEIEQREEA